MWVSRLGLRNGLLIGSGLLAVMCSMVIVARWDNVDGADRNLGEWGRPWLGHDSVESWAEQIDPLADSITP